MDDSRRPVGGYTYVVTEEQIRKYRAVPPEKKLQWLEDANRFLAKALTGKRRELWKSFREGTIG